MMLGDWRKVWRETIENQPVRCREYSALNKVVDGLSHTQRVRLKKPLIIAGCLCGCAVILSLSWRARRPPPLAWQVSIPGLNGEQISVGRDGTVYVETGRILHALDRNGKERWVSPKGLTLESWPALGKDGTIYANVSMRTVGPLTNGTFHGLVALNSDASVKWWFPVDEIRATFEKTLVLGGN